MALPLPAVVALVRDGLFTLYGASDTICTVVRWSRPIVQKKYPSNVFLQTAMDNVMVACQALRLGIQDQKIADQQAAGAPPEPVTPDSPIPPPAP